MGVFLVTIDPASNWTTESDIIFQINEPEWPNPATDWTQPNDTVLELVSAPNGAVYSYAMLPVEGYRNGQFWKLRASVGGEYVFVGSRTLQQIVNPYASILEQTNDPGSSPNPTLDIEGPLVPPITQAHNLTEAPSGNCANVGISVTTSQDMASCGGEIVTGDLKQHTLEKGRSESLLITVVAADTQYGQNSLTNSDTVPLMGDIYANGSYQDVTVTLAEVPNTYTYNFGDGYQTLNKYHYDTEGLKTINVKDAWGCEKQTTYTAVLLPDGGGDSDADDIFYISKSNSLRMVEQVEFDLCDQYKTDENTFDCEVPYLETNYEYTQRIKKCNDIRTQVKTNFDVRNATLTNELTGDVTAMPISLVELNIGIVDARPYLRQDDDIYSYIYFENKELPYFYEIGGEAVINGETAQILGFVYLEDQDTLSIQVQLLTVPEGGDINYTYNKHEYNTYEFTLLSSGLGNGTYHVNLDCSRTLTGTVKAYQSTTFEMVVEAEQTVDITYYSDSNTDMYYGSGIKNFLTVGIESIFPVLSLETEVVSTDSINYLKESFNIEKVSMTFEPLTGEWLRKLVVALSNDKLFINSTGYAVESVELNIPNDETNVYVLTAVMFKAGSNLKFVGTGQTQFTWASGVITFDSSITFDRTVY